MSKGNRTPRTEKQLAASRQSHGGGRPRTGKTPQPPIVFPTEWVNRLVAILPPGVPRNRWIMPQLEPILRELESGEE